MAGSDTESSHSDEPQATLLSVVTREANSRADAMFAQMVGATFAQMVGPNEPLGREENDGLGISTSVAVPPADTVVPPWRRSATESTLSSTPAPRSAESTSRGDVAGDSTAATPKSAPSASPSATTPRSAPSASPSATAAAASADTPSPISMLVPLEWNQVLFFTNPRTGVQGFDTKNSPVPLPYPNMEFRGYIEGDSNTVSAFFTDKNRRGQPGTRMPKKPDGGEESTISTTTV